jgi:hypothetical protein
VNRPDRRKGCLFCGNVDGRFDSEEHIVPLTTGNTPSSGLVEQALIIPPGSICDKCNGRRLSQRDQAFAEWPPVSAFRILAQIRNRRGRLLDATKGTEWDLRFNPTDPREFRLDLRANTGSESGREEVARDLCKIAVETRFLDDPVDARSPRWDTVAAAAIGGPVPRGVAMGLKIPANLDAVDLGIESHVMVNPWSTDLQMCLRLHVVGLVFSLLLDTPPPPLADTAWWVLGTDGSLSGPSSMGESFHGRAAAVRKAPPGGPPAAKHSSKLSGTDPRLSIFLTPAEENEPDTDRPGRASSADRESP